MISVMINIYLLWGAWQDLRKKSISDRYLWLGGLTGFGLKIGDLISGNILVREWILAWIPGIMLLFLAKITKEKIGYGDGWVFIIMGNFLDIFALLIILLTAIFFVMFFAIVLWISKKVTKEYQIPFLPFLWLAHMVLWRVNCV